MVSWTFPYEGRYSDVIHFRSAKLNVFSLPLSWNIFHGARIVDIHAAGLALRKALNKDQILVGVGYSMGGIILNNYVAKAGKDCALDAAISISGGLDMRKQKEFYRAQRLWQPLLIEKLRDEFLIGKWGERVRRRLSKGHMRRLMRATHITVGF